MYSICRISMDVELTNIKTEGSFRHTYKKTVIIKMYSLYLFIIETESVYIFCTNHNLMTM